LTHLVDESAPPEVCACVGELRYAATWFAGELGKRSARARERTGESTVEGLSLSAGRIATVPTAADRLRLINRGQRSLVAQIDTLLAEDLDPDLRGLLQEGRGVHLRGVQRCDDVIAMLDRGREIPRATK
jgi:hypothetical protein